MGQQSQRIEIECTIHQISAHHHRAEQMVLFADFDSGGWPMQARNRAIDLMCKAFAFHIVGDQHGQEKSSGYGLVLFDQVERTMKVEAYRFLANLSRPNSDNQFPGWPHTIAQLDNYGREATGHLPTIEVTGVENPVMIITNETSGDLEYAVRIKGQAWAPMVFSQGAYTVKVGNPDLDMWGILTNLQPGMEGETNIVKVQF